MDLREINLEEGMPTVDTAMTGMKFSLRSAKANGETAVKLIHGYGSSGKGGKIKQAVQVELAKMKAAGTIREFIRGEDFSPFSESGRTLLTCCPASAKDHDYSRSNCGITIVLLR